MLSLQRLNQDSSWLLKFSSVNLLIDPWLVGHEISGFSWFSEQWHIHPPIAVKDIPDAIDYIIISQPYSDHCHIESLDLLPANIPIIAVAAAIKTLKNKFPDRTIISLGDSGEWLELKNFRITSIYHHSIFSPKFSSLILENEQKENILYAPHGAHKSIFSIPFMKIKYLLSTTTTFKLPFFLGGAVNPGLKHCLGLIKHFKPAFFINTHDEQKGKKGLVAQLAKVEYIDKINKHIPSETKYIAIPDYESVSII